MEKERTSPGNSDAQHALEQHRATLHDHHQGMRRVVSEKEKKKKNDDTTRPPDHSTPTSKYNAIHGDDVTSYPYEN